MPLFPGRTRCCSHAARLIAKVARAVHYAHQHGILHRDLKPGNILLDEDGNAYLADFGIAKAIAQPLTDKTFVTFQGQLLGTPEYMSPEQVDLATQDIDTRSDIYSLGVLLYELLTGTQPFRAASSYELIRKVIEDIEGHPVPEWKILDYLAAEPGTDAVLLYIESITHNGREVVFNRRKMGELATYLLKMLKGIQYGTVEDRHGWMFAA